MNTSHSNQKSETNSNSQGLEYCGSFMVKKPDPKKRSSLLRSISGSESNIKRFNQANHPFAPSGAQTLTTQKSPEQIKEEFLSKQQKLVVGSSKIAKQLEKEDKHKQQLLEEKQKYDAIRNEANQVAARNEQKKKELERQQRIESLDELRKLRLQRYS